MPALPGYPRKCLTCMRVFACIEEKPVETMSTQDVQETQLQIGEWVVSPNACTLRNKISGGAAVKITPRSMDVLCYLSRYPDEVVSPSTLLEHIWHSRVATDHAVHKAIAELRGALHDKAQDPQYIRTVPKRGYALIAPVSETPRETPAAPAEEHWRQPAAARRPWLTGIAAALALVTAISAVLIWQRSPPLAPEDDEVIQLAVLPFDSRAFDDENQILADGIREALVNGLSKLSHLQVMSPARVGLPEGSDPPLENIQAHVDHVLRGSVLSSNGRLRVIVQLVRVEDGVHEYSDQFDLPMTDIFSIQDDIVSNVVSALRVHLDENERSQMLDWGTGNALAYEHFMRGEFYNNQFNPEDFRRAISEYQAALEQDPEFLNAYHGIATAANNLAVYSDIETINELYEVVLDVHRELSRVAPESEILDSIHAIKLRMSGNNQPQQESELRRQILSGDPPDYAIAHYALFLIGARLYDEASRYLELASEVGPFEISPDEVWSYRNNVKPPREVIQARKMQLQQRPYHIGFLGAVATNLAFVGDFRQAQIYQDRREAVDADGVLSDYSADTIAFLRGDITADSAALEQAIRENDPDYMYNNGALSFMVGDLERGVEFWRKLHPVQLRRLFNMAHIDEKFFPDSVLESPRYHALLEELGTGKSWQRRLMEGVMAMEERTGVNLSEQARQAYRNETFMRRNDLWSGEEWEAFNRHRRRHHSSGPELMEASLFHQ